MSSHILPVKIVLENNDQLDLVFQSLAKKYSLNLSLPLSHLNSFNQAFSLLNRAFSLFSQQLARIIAFKPDLFAISSAISNIKSNLGPAFSPLNAKDNALLNSAANSLSALSLLSQLSTLNSQLGAAPQLSALNSQLGAAPQLSTLNSQLGAAPSTLPPQSGLDSAGHYRSALDLIMQALQDYHDLPALIESELSSAIDALRSQFDQDISSPFIYPYQVSDLESQLQQDFAYAISDAFSAHISKLSDIYDLLKFWLPSYYDAKKQSIIQSADLVHSADPENKQSYIDQNLASLNADKLAFNDSALSDLVASYQSEMAHLSSLHSMSLISYDEVIEKAWEYFRALKAIALADGDVSQAEQELLDLFRSRAQRAQLAKNREGSDLTQYYNYVKFLDSSYYDWKKARIEEDVRLMDISEEQKAALIKAKHDALKLELQDFKPDKSLFDHLLDALDIPTEHQAKIKSSFQFLANQISSIWSQLYSNLASNRDQSLADLEHRAKKERKTDAWLAKEKDRINEEYEKKHRSLKRTEQKMQIASATANTLEGITNALTVKPAWLAPIMAASVGALGFAQVKLIAEQKFATGGHFRGRGSSTSDSNIIAVSDNEYIVSADRVNRFGVPFFDALNFGNGEQIRKALSSIRIPTPSISYPAKTHGYASGGVVRPQTQVSQNVAMNVVLKCDGKALAKAVIKGKKKIIST